MAPTVASAVPLPTGTVTTRPDTVAGMLFSAVPESDGEVGLPPQAASELAASNAAERAQAVQKARRL